MNGDLVANAHAHERTRHLPVEGPVIIGRTVVEDTGDLFGIEAHLNTAGGARADRWQLIGGIAHDVDKADRLGMRLAVVPKIIGRLYAVCGASAGTAALVAAQLVRSPITAPIQLLRLVRKCLMIDRLRQGREGKSAPVFRSRKSAFVPGAILIEGKLCRKHPGHPVVGLRTAWAEQQPSGQRGGGSCRSAFERRIGRFNTGAFFSASAASAASTSAPIDRQREGSLHLQLKGLV